MYKNKEPDITKENHGEWVVIRYIFRVMYGKKEFDVMDNESV
jgi:hypothetical protein